MSIASLPAALLVALQPPEPPVPVIAVPSPPPMRSRAPRPTATFDVRISAEHGLLWEGPLRVGQNGANVMQSRSEAAPETCGNEARGFGAVSTILRIALRAISMREGDPAYQLEVNWTRPGSPDGCPAGGSRSIQLEQIVSITQGEQATVRGDAGLTVQIRRRARP